MFSTSSLLRNDLTVRIAHGLVGMSWTLPLKQKAVCHLQLTLPTALSSPCRRLRVSAVSACVLRRGVGVNRREEDLAGRSDILATFSAPPNE